MSFEACPNANEDCRFFETERGCVTNTHHIYWPKKRYTTDVEKEFRQLPGNKEQMCMAEHLELHATERPPKKPSRSIMLNIINESLQGRSDVLPILS